MSLKTSLQQLMGGTSLVKEDMYTKNTMSSYKKNNGLTKHRSEEIFLPCGLFNQPEASTLHQAAYDSTSLTS